MFETCETCGQPVIPRYCPHCAALIDGHTAVDLSGRCPKTGDVSICLFCSGISIFTKTSLRIPSDEEWTEILAQQDTKNALAAIASMREEGKIPPCQ